LLFCFSFPSQSLVFSHGIPGIMAGL
jgi:hypothetical protein